MVCKVLNSEGKQMSRVTTAEKLTLQSVERKFGLQEIKDDTFFSEWQTSLPALTDFEKAQLVHIKDVYENFVRRSAIESTINLTIVSPLLDTAGLFIPPFHVETEKSVEISAKDDSVIVKGRLDILVIKDALWILTIESKRAEFSLIVGIPQVLTYMLAAPTSQKQLYGMVTNGRNFIFIKLDRTSKREPVYAQSKEFILNQDNDLEQIFKIIKRLADIAAAQP